MALAQRPRTGGVRKCLKSRVTGDLKIHLFGLRVNQALRESGASACLAAAQSAASLLY